MRDYLLRQQAYQHEESMAIVDAIEDVRDGLDAILHDNDITVPARRRLTGDKEKKP